MFSFFGWVFLIAILIGLSPPCELVFHTCSAKAFPEMIMIYSLVDRDTMEGVSSLKTAVWGKIYLPFLLAKFMRVTVGERHRSLGSDKPHYT